MKKENKLHYSVFVSVSNYVSRIIDVSMCRKVSRFTYNYVNSFIYSYVYFIMYRAVTHNANSLIRKRISDNNILNNEK